MMKKITLLSLVLLLNYICTNAQVQIGNGTNTYQNLPVEAYMGSYSYSQSIYLAEEINTPAGNITGLQWYYNGTSTLPNTQDLVIYMANTTKTTFTDGTDWLVGSNLTQVYSGGISVTGPGWVTITFDTPFAYNGTDNLIIAAEDNMDGYDSSSKFYNTNMESNRSIYYYSDGTNPEPNNPPTGYTTTYVPNVIIEGITPTCLPVSGVSVANTTTTATTISWTENSGAQNWTIEYGDVNFELGSGTSLDVTTNPYTLDNLTPGTTYQYYIKAVCGTDDLSTWAGPFEFTTACDAITEFYQDFEAATIPSLPNCWSSIVQGAGTYGGVTTVNYYAFESTNAAMLSNDNATPNANVMLVSPAISNLADGTHWVTFNGRITNNVEQVEIGTITDPNNANTFTLLTTISLANSYDFYSYSFENYTGSDNYIAFKMASNTPYSYIYLDNITYEEMPSCVFPFQTTASNITESSADVSWVGNSTNYEYVLNTTEDAPTSGTAISTNTLSFDNLDANTTYYFHVRANCSSTDNSDWITIPFTTLISNNTCANAIEITASNYPDCTNTISGTTANATNTISTSCGNTNYSDVWYSITPETTGSYYFSTSNASAYVTLWSGSCGSLSQLTTNCYNNFARAELTAGTTYYIAVGSYVGTSYTFDLCARLLPEAPANDACADATTVNELPFTESLDAAGATNNNGFINTCTSSYGVNDGVWYTFTVNTPGNVTFDITNIDAWQAEVGVYSGSCGNFTCEGFDSSYTNGESLNLTIAVVPNTTYFVNVGYNNGYTDYLEGNFTITIDSDTDVLSNDSFTELNNFTYYPNPVNQNKLTLNATENIQNIAVYNLVGQNVLQVAPNTSNYVLNMSSLQSGSYFVAVTINGNTETVKVLKQ